MACHDGWMRLPDFLVIGAYKSGTSSLHHHLRSHPDIYIPEAKEPSFWAFSDGANPERPARAQAVVNQQQYLEMFAPAGSKQLLGEVSPEYMTAPGTCERIKNGLPDVRLIAILRNPVERAYSDYLMYRRLGLESETQFSAALADQERRARASLPHGSYLSTGCYAAQIQPYVEQFGQRLLVLRFDSLKSEAPQLIARIHNFLGVEPLESEASAEVHNVSGIPSNRAVALAYRARHKLRPILRGVVPDGLNKSVGKLLQRGLEKPPLPPEDRAWLQDFYRSDVADLSALTGIDFSDWLTAES